MKKILLLGDTGKMGTAVRAQAQGRFVVSGRNAGNIAIDDPQAVAVALAEEEPDIVINTIAMLGIDACESLPEQAFRRNALLPRTLAAVCRERNCTLVHFSTSSVFPNHSGMRYVEDDRPQPVNVYGCTKLAGDHMVQAVGGRHYIFRLPVLFGPSACTGHFVERILDQVRAGDPVAVADDVTTSPTYSMDVAERLLAVVADEQLPYGLYHMANDGDVSLFEWITTLVAALDLPAAVQAASHAALPAQGPKHLSTALQSARLAPLRPWQAAVQAYAAWERTEQSAADADAAEPAQQAVP